MTQERPSPVDDGADPGRVGNRPAWLRYVSVLVRAAHLLAASAAAGACLLGIHATDVHGWWMAAGVSGVLLLVTELMRHPQLYREPAGWATVLKLALIGAIFAAPSAGPWLMSAAFVVAVVGAHAPKRFRHKKLF